MRKQEIIKACARAAHEANLAYCKAIGDDSAMRGVEVALSGATPEQQHDAWCADKRAAGWVYGPIKDPAAKTHPCLLPYAELPDAQRRKDGLYLTVVRGMARALTGGRDYDTCPCCNETGFGAVAVDPISGIPEAGPCRGCGGDGKGKDYA